MNLRSNLRVARKTAVLLPHLLYGLSLAGYVGLIGDRFGRREHLGRHWQRRLLRILDVRVHVHGTPPAGAILMVANHVSWLDIIIIAALAPARFISKAEVRDWPLAGWLVTAAGTFYLQRGAGGTRKLVENVACYIRAGGAIALFPEGTTTTGQSALRFQPRLFAAAIESGCPVQPVALRYAPGRAGDDVAAFVGDDDLVSNLLRLMREPGIDVEITFCTPLDSRSADRTALALAAHSAVSAAIAGNDKERIRHPSALAA